MCRNFGSRILLVASIQGSAQAAQKQVQHQPEVCLIPYIKWTEGTIRGHFQTILGKINVIVTLTFDPPPS